MATPIYIVRGNYKALTVKLAERVFLSDGNTEVQNYTFADGDKVSVNLVGAKKYPYTPTIKDNELSFAVMGELPNGSYGVEVLITTAAGLPLRSFSRSDIKVVETNAEAGLSDDEVDSTTPAIVQAVVSSYEQAVIVDYSTLATKVDASKQASLDSKTATEVNTTAVNSLTTAIGNVNTALLNAANLIGG